MDGCLTVEPEKMEAAKGESCNSAVLGVRTVEAEKELVRKNKNVWV